MVTGNDNSLTIPEFLWFGSPVSPPVHVPNSSDRDSLGEREKVHCVCACMHACIHAGLILLGAKRDPETSTFRSVDGAMGEGETRRGGGFKDLQQLQCRSQRNMLKSGSTAHSPIHTYPQPLCRPPIALYFSTVAVRPKSH